MADRHIKFVVITFFYYSVGNELLSKVATVIWIRLLFSCCYFNCYRYSLGQYKEYVRSRNNATASLLSRSAS